jgi:pimeloyl-ACP methyl ester carboxylesterase
VFSYDWRRPLDEAAELLERFLEMLAEEVGGRLGSGHDPRPGINLVGHSLGGLVALLLLQRLSDRLGKRSEAITAWLNRVVTVGTPFYGTAAALASYYNGLPLLNLRYGAEVIARVIGTFPGPPLVHFLDRATYHEYVRAFAERGEEPELARYPCWSGGDQGGEEWDLYAPEAQSGYPAWKRSAFLKGALTLRQRMHRRLPPEFMSRLFHIRGAGDETCCELVWRGTPGGSTYQVGMPVPFEGRLGVGDGIVPRWSARYCHTPREQVWSIKTRADHAFLMEDAAVLDGVQHLVIEGTVPPESREAARAGRRRAVATREHAEEVFANAYAGNLAKSDVVLRRYSLWRRFFADIAFG